MLVSGLPFWARLFCEAFGNVWATGTCWFTHQVCILALRLMGLRVA